MQKHIPVRNRNVFFFLRTNAFQYTPLENSRKIESDLLLKARVVILHSKIYSI